MLLTWVAVAQLVSKRGSKSILQSVYLFRQGKKMLIDFLLCGCIKRHSAKPLKVTELCRSLCDS